MRVRASLTDREFDPSGSGRFPQDLDRLAAALHGRRARMVEGERLDRFCRIRTIGELGEAVFPGSRPTGLLDFQRLTIQRLILEMSGLLSCLSGPGARLLHWLLVRFQAEELKVLIRIRFGGSPQINPHDHLINLPPHLSLPVRALADAGSLDDFIHLLREGVLRKSLIHAVTVYGPQPPPFFLEAALDQGYFQELLALTEELPGEDRNTIKPVFLQETDIFHFMLIVRGRFHYGLTRELLLPLHVRGAKITATLFDRMLGDPDLRTSAGRVVGLVFDPPLPGEGTKDPIEGALTEPAILERLAWKRLARLANLAFRTSHMGLGAVVGYILLRRTETANLTTLSEALRKTMDPETIRSRMIVYENGGGHRV